MFIQGELLASVELFLFLSCCSYVVFAAGYSVCSIVVHHIYDHSGICSNITILSITADYTIRDMVLHLNIARIFFLLI